MDIRNLEQKSLEYRKQLLRYIKMANAGHTGGSLSCIDILNVLYNQVMHVSPAGFSEPDRDRYIHSKGHSVEALYVVLADRGFFPETDLETLCRYGSPYVGHPTRSVNGIEQNTGALGHGLSVGAGMALAGKMDRLGYRVYVLLGDGELTEGSNWEAALFAAHHRLENLLAVVDCNRMQITGPTAEVCNTEPLEEKFRAFGWSVRQTNGHDFREMIDAFSDLPFDTGKPGVVIARTVKGKGVSFMENDSSWHHRVPDDTQYEAAIRELQKPARDG